MIYGTRAYSCEVRCRAPRQAGHDQAPSRCPSWSHDPSEAPGSTVPRRHLEPPIPPRAPLQPLLHSLWCAGHREEEPGHPQPGRPGPARPRPSTHCHWRPGCCAVRDISLVNLRLNPSGTPTAMVGRASRRETGTPTAWSAGRRAAPTGVPTAWPAGLLRGARSAIR
jgi:hypothetical protein